MTAYRILSTSFGDAAVIAAHGRPCRILLPQSPDGLRASLGRHAPEAAEDAGLLPRLCADLTRYFQGEPVEFEDPPHFNGATPFMQAAWRACREIPYGATATYGELARRLGRPRAARAVGLAMARNPLPILVPCHRVLAADGRLGGFSAASGTSLKRQLLDMERAALAHEGVARCVSAS